MPPEVQKTFGSLYEPAMKYDHNCIVYALFIACTAFYSCEKDDGAESDSKKNVIELDYTLPASGSIMVTNEKSSTPYVIDVDDAGYRLWSDQGLEFTYIWYGAHFYGAQPVSVPSFWENHQKVYSLFITQYFHKMEVGPISFNGTIKVRYGVENDGRYEYYFQKGNISGMVNVVRYDLNKTITLEFKDCKFNASDSHVYPGHPASSSTKGEFNGEITFPLRKKDFFKGWIGA